MSVGWDHSGWTGLFYPEDLPREWRLTYYANEFRGVLLPFRSWITARRQNLADWADDVHEGFQFYLELKQMEDLQACQERVLPLGKNFTGFVLDKTEPLNLAGRPPWWNEEAGQSVLFANRLTDLTLPAHSDAGSRTVFRIPCEELTDMMQQRKLLEQAVEWAADGSQVLLFLEGDPPSVEKIRNLKLLAQFLGFA